MTTEALRADNVSPDEEGRRQLGRGRRVPGRCLVGLHRQWPARRKPLVLRGGLCDLRSLVRVERHQEAALDPREVVGASPPRLGGVSVTYRIKSGSRYTHYRAQTVSVIWRGTASVGTTR